MPNRPKYQPPASMMAECFRLDPLTGDLYWLIRPRHHFRTQQGQQHFNRLYAGKRADEGIYPTKGYKRVRLTELNGRKYAISAHRVVVAILTGAWPELEVDHKDRVKNNNIPANLRDVTHSQNMLNRNW